MSDTLHPLHGTPSHRAADGPPSRRRRLLAGGLGLGATLLAAGCAGLGGPRTIEVSEARLLEALNRQFPFNSRVLGALELVVVQPRLKLLPAENRLATEFDVNVDPLMGGRPIAGTLGLSYGLRFDAAEHSVKLEQPRVERLDLGSAGGWLQGRAGRVAAALAENLLSELRVYQLPPDDVQRLQSHGLRPGAIRVTPHGLAISLEPVR